jgi:hypothetical protein
MRFLIKVASLIVSPLLSKAILLADDSLPIKEKSSCLGPLGATIAEVNLFKNKPVNLITFFMELIIKTL